MSVGRVRLGLSAPPPNSSFKPTPLRYGKSLAEKACQSFASTTRRGLTQVLGLMPTLSRAMVVLMLAVAAGCASLTDGPDRPLTAPELVGTYEFGRAGFAETVELHADGSYTRTLLGHLGQDSASFDGTWRVEGNRILFTPGAGLPSSSAPEPSEAFFYRHKPAFAPQRLIKFGRVDDWFVYVPQASR